MGTEFVEPAVAAPARRPPQAPGVAHRAVTRRIRRPVPAPEPPAPAPSRADGTTGRIRRASWSGTAARREAVPLRRLTGDRSARGGGFHYDAVPPDKIAGFPSPLGETDLTEVPATPVLETAEVGRGGANYRTLRSSRIAASYASERNASMGAAQGRFEYGMAIRRGGTWTGDITRFVRGAKTVAWRNGAEPADGVYKFELEVTADDAAAIAAGEKEHRDDFALAWQETFGRLARLVDGVRWYDVGDGDDRPVAALVDAALGSRARWLVPASPERLDTWGQHVKAQFAALADHSKKRDRQGHHSPVLYDGRLDGGRIVLRFGMPPARPSTDYIKPSELPTPFAAGSLAAHRQAVASASGAAQSKVGKPVRFAGTAPTTGYRKPDLSADNIDDGAGVREGLADPSAVLECLDADGIHGWVKITAFGDLAYIAPIVYVRVPVAGLS